MDSVYYSFSRHTEIKISTMDLTSEHDFEIHGFCDASQRAICATVYLRSSNQEEKVTTHLICSKTKVTPLKKLTIPRLELSGAVLLTNLVSRVSQILRRNCVPIFLWKLKFLLQL